VTSETATILGVLILVVALLYSSVGHGGASGYLAAMALLGVAPEVMRPTALMLNVLVASIATVQFARAGYFRWRLLWPFAVASIPAAAVGGAIHLPGEVYRPVIGAVLLFSAWRLTSPRLARGGNVDAGEAGEAGGGGGGGEEGQPARPPALGVALGVGLALGLLAGLSGTGGGIFLSPIILLCGWGTVKQTAAASSAFILVNSIAGLVGLWTSNKGGGGVPVEVYTWLLPWGAAAVVGGLIGSQLGARWLGARALRLLLAAVLVVAGVKLIAVW